MIIREMLKNDGVLRLCWLGNDGWLIAKNGRLVATDLDLHLSMRTLPPFPGLAALAEGLEYLFISHAHSDHFSPKTVGFLLQQGGTRLVLPRSCAGQAASYGFDESRILWAVPGEAQCPAAWLEFSAIRALHGHIKGSVYSGASFADCGYILGLPGCRLLQPGDSVLMEEHLSAGCVDVLFVSPTEHNMKVDMARTFIEAVNPRHIFAQHFGTYQSDESNAFWTRGYQRELENALPEEYRKRFIIPEYMRVYEVN